MTTMTIAARASAEANLKIHFAPSTDDRPLKVLCATDLWSSPDHAVKRALTLAQEANADATILHVVDEEAPLRVIGRRADRAQSALRWRVRQLRPTESSAEISVRIGKPLRTIARAARDSAADLIVVGAYRARKADWLLGASAESLSAAANCPVLVVNREAEAAYTEVALAAGSLDDAITLAHSAYDLEVLPREQPLLRTMLYSSVFENTRGRLSPTAFEAAIEQAGLKPERLGRFELYRETASIAERFSRAAAPELVAVTADRCALLKRAFGLSVVNKLVRTANCDVLIIPTSRARRSDARMRDSQKSLQSAAAVL